MCAIVWWFLSHHRNVMCFIQQHSHAKGRILKTETRLLKVILGNHANLCYTEVQSPLFIMTIV